MLSVIKIILVLCVLVSIFDNGEQTTTCTKQYRHPSKKEIKRMRKARDKAEMDAFEDIIMYCEVFMDD